jgi:hypothetical protein
MTRLGRIGWKPAALCAAGTLFACAAPNDARQIVGIEPENGMSRVQVVNDNWSDVRVRLVVGGTTVLLGTVDGFSTRTLRLPSPVKAACFRLEPVGGRAQHTTEEVVVGQYHAIELRVGTNLKNSMLTLR